MGAAELTAAPKALIVSFPTRHASRGSTGGAAQWRHFCRYDVTISAFMEAAFAG